MNILCDDLMPVLKQLQSEGLEVYSYTSMDMRQRGTATKSLYWFENGCVLNIQPDEFGWYYNLGVSYIPSSANGSGCRLTHADGYGYHPEGVRADEVLKFRNAATWVRGAQNYKSMEHFLKEQSKFVLKFAKLDADGKVIDETP